MRTGFAAVLAALMVSLVPALAGAQDGAPDVTVELNKLEPRGEACRAYLVLENKTDSAFEALKLDLVMFDPGGVVAKRLAVEAAPLPAGKTSLKVFDLTDLPCGQVGRILLNDVLVCADESGQRDDCLAKVRPSARGNVPFFK